MKVHLGLFSNCCLGNEIGLVRAVEIEPKIPLQKAVQNMKVALIASGIFLLTY